MKPMKIGIVYYSRTGNTRNVAKILEEKFKEKNTEVDLIEIEHEKRPGFFAASRAAMKQEELPIKNTNFDLGHYDIILAGTPTWAGRPAPFLKSFLRKAEHITGKTVAFFGTGGGSITKRDEFQRILKNELEPLGIKIADSSLTLAFKKGQLVDGQQHIDDFITTILHIPNG
ncbi:MAG: flavodoxin family protein [Candidatus Thermoplasmatota archaeon]|nr:flavodoxin family protein [Candidatus Thermoplasmatota archaeon]